MSHADAFGPPLPAGTVAVVTGAAHGIGRATAERLGRAGARLALVDVDAAALAKVVQAIEGEGGVARPFETDVADAREVARLAPQVLAELGPCAILVNNAGVLMRGRFDDADAPEQWTRTLATNLQGAFQVCRAFLPALESTRGCIVNVASIHAFSAVGISAAYTASKGGLKQLTQALAVELADRGIRVNAVAPGAIRTAMTGERASLEGPGGFLGRVPMRRLGEADEVAAVIHFLASGMASYVTGGVIPVDGGYLAA